jgi:hyperosmotically inducible protein
MRSRLLVGMVAAAGLTTACAQSDARITASVKSQLAADDSVKARTIDVDTRDRVVTLTGEVSSAAEEARALRIAREARGVTRVIDKLAVVDESEALPTTGDEDATATEPGTGDLLAGDARITSRVKAKLLGDPDIAGFRINVDTQDGVVTLTGTVGTQAEKTQALERAREVVGAAAVRDRLIVEGRP